MEDRYNLNFLEEELHRPSVFINENLLSIDYVPEHLVYSQQFIYADTAGITGLPA